MATVRTHTFTSSYDPENFQRSRHAKNPDAHECGVCGRATLSRKWQIHLVEGSMEVIAHPDDVYERESADMGWWYVGSDCVKKLPADFVLTIP